MLTPEQQAHAYDNGYFYPGPAVKGVSLDMAPQKSQEAIAGVRPARVRRADRAKPEGDAAAAKELVAAFDKWDREVGGAKVKED